MCVCVCVREKERERERRVRCFSTFMSIHTDRHPNCTGASCSHPDKVTFHVIFSYQQVYFSSSLHCHVSLVCNPLSSSFLFSSLFVSFLLISSLFFCLSLHFSSRFVSLPVLTCTTSFTVAVTPTHPCIVSNSPQDNVGFLNNGGIRNAPLESSRHRSTGGRHVRC